MTAPTVSTAAQPMMANVVSALIIDTCGETGYVAAGAVDEAEPAAWSERRLGRRATQEQLLPAIHAVLEQAELRLAELAAIAVVSGPGSFTGVRIGVATAKGLCEAVGVPLVMLSRLEVLAAAAKGRPGWAWLQAGRGEVYARRFVSETSSDMAGLVPGPDEGLVRDRLLTLEQAISHAAGETVAVCEEPLREAVPHAVFVSPQDFEQALRNTTAKAVRSRTWSDVALADAVYGRVPDAELALRARRQ